MDELPVLLRQSGLKQARDQGQDISFDELDPLRIGEKYVLGTPEDVTSSFQQSDLPTWTLRLLSQVRGVRATDIPGLLVNTFGGYAASRARCSQAALPSVPCSCIRQS
jgi:hypothetical protein